MENIPTTPAFTPSPWYADLVDLIIYDDRHTKIAVVHQQIEPTEDSDVTSANARLIAAAPELLDTCKMLLAVLLKDCDAEAFGSEISHAEGVIAEAEGA